MPRPDGRSWNELNDDLEKKIKQIKHMTISGMTTLHDRQLAIKQALEMLCELQNRTLKEASEKSIPLPNMAGPFEHTALADVIGDAMWDSNNNRIGGIEAAAEAVLASGLVFPIADLPKVVQETARVTGLISAQLDDSL